MKTTTQNNKTNLRKAYCCNCSKEEHYCHNCGYYQPADNYGGWCQGKVKVDKNNWCSSWK